MPGDRNVSFVRLSEVLKAPEPRRLGCQGKETSAFEMVLSLALSTGLKNYYFPYTNNKKMFIYVGGNAAR